MSQQTSPVRQEGIANNLFFMSTILIIIISAVISIVVSFLVFSLLALDGEELNTKFSKVWARIQRAEALADREYRFAHKELERMAKGITETRSIMTTISGFKSMDYNKKHNHIVATNTKDERFLLDLNHIPAVMTPLKLQSKKDAGLQIIKYKGLVLEYKKPVSTDF